MSKREDDQDITKISFNLPRSVLRKVEELSRCTGFNKTTIICHAIDVAAYIDDVQRREGKILVKEKDEDIKELIFK